MQNFCFKMANELASFTLANNPAGSQINNELFLCAVFHTLLYVFCLFKIANIALGCHNCDNHCVLLLHDFADK